MLLLGFVGFVLFAPESGKERVEGPVEGSPAPAFELKDTDGNPWRLASLKGSVVLLNFWATWCASCREEMPSLNSLFEKSAMKTDFVILTVLYNDDPGKASAYLEEKGYGFPVLLDHDFSVASRYGLTGVPETFIIDKKGVLRKKIIGPTGFDSPNAIQFFEALLRE